MLEHFQPRHLPFLFAATSATLSGAWTLYDTRVALLAFGLPERVAGSRAAGTAITVGHARTTSLGLCMWTFYLRGDLAACDTVLAIFLAWTGIVDSYVVWREGHPGKAVLRALGSALLSYAGFVGFTAGV
ncbi:hypothetical protein F4778DRAFT_779048 [Xylariomycetidae sp. FL2044]|nr:hypothetical protein F4778DRAFT_779048 [Xylariomycetidae sp. FL2044]